MIYTSYWAKLKKIPRSIHAISICRYPPPGEWTNCYRFIPSMRLYNRYKSKEIDFKTFCDEYYQQIVNSEENIFYKLNNCVLLCYEKNPNECHRSVARKYLIEIGYECEEWEEEKNIRKSLDKEEEM